jgi:tetratricopeptide (TPR) repeat protein
MSFLKILLFQLLERNVGDARLYEKLVKAFETYSGHKDAKELELALWESLKVGLETVDSRGINLVIVVDGFDEITGGENAANLHKRLHDCVDKFSRTRAITLSKPVSHLGGAKCKHLLITPEHTQHDIAAYLRQNLAQYQHYNSQNHGTQEKFVEDLVKKAKGSFLWAYLVIKSLRSETSYESFFKAGLTMHSDVHGLLHKLVEKADLKNPTTKHMLEFMLVAKRPLRVGEMEHLLSVNLQKRTITPITDIGKHIASSPCSVFVVERKGLIRFKHSAIQKFFNDELCGKTLLSIKEAHTELTKRMLLYARYHTLAVSYEPSFDVPRSAVLDETFRSHFLMEYIVRNWVSHFRSSALCGAKGKLALSSEFKEIFPASTFFAMIEWSCWQSQMSITEAMECHDLALRIRKACFGEKHPSVMQTVIIMGTFYRSMSDLVKASEFFYHASCIGQAILYKFSTVVVACTSLFLTCTETFTFTKRTEIVTYKENMIRFMIEICKCKHGASSNQVIKWYEVLAKLYIDIKEEYRATIVYKELYEIILIRFGKGHPRARGISETLGRLNVVLQGGSEEEVVEYNEWIFETSEDMEVTHELRISITIRLAHTYEAQGKWFLAEKLYINLWRRISEICRVKASIEMHMAKINISLEYVRFLQRIKRIEEASNILICLWAEYEHHTCESETLIIRIKEIGILFKTFGLLTVALSVFTKVWGWFKSKGKTDHEDAISITVLITEVVEEITETTTVTTTTTTTTVTETVTETILTEIFETSYTRCKDGNVDAHFFKACIALISLYIKQKKWSACEVVIKRSLELTWKAVLTVDAEITLSGSFTKESILIANQLAICYHRQKYFEKAEEIYLRIYRACLTSFSIEDIRVTEASLALIHFYEEYHRHEKAIEIYVELLHGYRKHCGAAHALTIKTLYALGSICIMLGRKDAYEYYIEIVTTLNKGEHCRRDAFEAAVIVCRYYYEEKRWAELQKICDVLWETFIHHQDEFKFTEEMITTLYERYIYVLEFHAKVEFSVLYKLSVQYCETVTKYFGVSAAIVITAMIALANICEKNEKHYLESATIYEEVIKKITTTTTTTVTETITKTVKKRLSKMYVTIITKGHSTTRTTIERGIAICLEMYESLKLEFGCWHEKTLTQLKELVILYKKHGSHESTIIRLLQTSVIEIITKVTSSITLYHAASTLASIYVSVGLVKYGQDLLHQLRHLIILHDIASSTEITISLGSKVSKVAFVFLVAFEQSLAEKLVLSYSEVMADILLETQLYEQYTQVIKTETKTEIVLEVGAKLHAFWAFRGRKVECDVLDRKLFAMFKAGYGACINTHDDITFIFYSALLVELGKELSIVDFGAIACLVSNLKVKALLEAGDFNKAHEVAKCAFQLISSQRFYHNMRNISYGYKLAECMAGIEVRTPTDNKVRESMLETSRKIVADVLAACREAKVNFVALKFEDVAGLVRLLGDQQNYGELEVRFIPFPSPFPQSLPPLFYDLLCCRLTYIGSLSWSNSGNPAKYKVPGRAPPSSASAAASCMRTTPPATFPNLSSCATPSATTCGARVAGWMPTPSPCPSSSPNCTLPQTATARRWACTRRSYGRSTKTATTRRRVCT